MRHGFVFIEAWFRFYSGLRKTAIRLELEEAQPSLIPIESGNQEVDFVECIEQNDQYELYKKLIKQLSKKKGGPRIAHSKAINNIKVFIEQHPAQLAPSLYRLCEWATELYRNGTEHKSRLATETIPKYLGQLQDIVHHLGVLDPLKLESEELIEIYQLMIDQTKSVKGKFYKIGRIKEFQSFLIKLGYYESLDLTELLNGRSAGSRIDANYLSEKEYLQSMMELNRIEKQNSRLQTIRRLVLMLGYRCGLRRTEAWKLRLCDIHWTQQCPALFVVATRDKSVKSTSSMRQLPLQSLMLAEELQEFMVWFEQRRAEQNLDAFETDSSFLFCHEHSGKSLVDEYEIFSVIHCVLRTVSGDSSLRYHHCRHSFANNLLIHLLGIQIRGLKFPSYGQTGSQAPDTQLFDRVFGLAKGTATRKHLFQVSALLGHGSPDISLLHYLHLSDVLLMSCLNEAHQDMSVNTLCTISGFSRDNLNKTRQRNYPGMPIYEISRIKLRQNILAKTADQSSVVETVSQDELIDWPESMVNSVLFTPFKEPSIAVLHQVVENCNSNDKNIVFWADRTLFTTEQWECWLNAAQVLAQMKTDKQAYRHLRAQWWGLQDQEKKEQLIKIHTTNPPSCMPRPHKRLDIQDSRITLEGIKKLRLENPEVAQQGITYYLTKSVASHPFLRMSSPEVAEKFSTFIQKVGFPKSRIRCQLKVQMRAGAQEPNQQMGYWAKLLGIKSTQIDLIQPIKERGADNGTLSIMLCYKDNKKTDLASYGFRYAIYMMGILMLAGGEICISE